MLEHAKIKRKLTVVHMRNGKVLEIINPYSDATIIEKILYWFGLKNLTK